MPLTRRPYAFHRDPADPRDHHRAIPSVAKLPPVLDLRHICPPIYDQGQLGSCTANAIAAALEIDLRRAQRPQWMPSRLFIYYNERVRMNTAATDAGGRLREGLKSIAQLGVCPEALWSYDEAKVAARPDDACYADGRRNLGGAYARIPQTSEALEQVLYRGRPVLFGFTVHGGFESQRMAQSGCLRMPAPREKHLGGHAVLCVGYDRPNQRFLIRNSWGLDWGLAGYFWMPYAYLCRADLAQDLWTVETFGCR
jgi:C1A family cysteine protease